MSTEAANKHTLFFSHHCAHSKDVVELIARRNIRNRFIFVCAEQYAGNLPSFVDCVPLLYTFNQEILTDEDLFLFLQNIPNLQQQQQKQKQMVVKKAEPELDMEPYKIGGLTDTFSFIEGDAELDSSSFESFSSPEAFEHLSSNKIPMQQQQRAAAIPSPNGALPQPIETRKQNSDFSSELDRFKATRDNDIAGLQQAQRAF